MVDTVWGKVLVRWMNCCLKPRCNVTSVNLKSLVEIINQYESDIELDREALRLQDLEPFLVHNYPAMRTWYLNEEKKESNITASLVLFHCVTNSQGAVDKDICTYMTTNEQRIILNFCEELVTQREINIFTINCAIRDACLCLYKEMKESSREKEKGQNLRMKKMNSSDSSCAPPMKTDGSPYEHQLSCCNSTPACSYSVCSPPKFVPSSGCLEPMQSEDQGGKIYEEDKQKKNKDMDSCSENEPEITKQYKNSRSTPQFTKVSFDDTRPYKERCVRDIQYFDKVKKPQFKNDIQPYKDRNVSDTQNDNKVIKTQFKKVNSGERATSMIQSFKERYKQISQQLNKGTSGNIQQGKGNDIKFSRQHSKDDVRHKEINVESTQQHSEDDLQGKEISIESTQQHSTKGENVIDREVLESARKLKDNVELKRKALVSFIDAQRQVLRESGVLPTKSEKDILSQMYRELKKAEDKLALAKKKIEKKVCGRERKKESYLTRMTKEHNESLICIFAIFILLLLMGLYFALSYYDNQSARYNWKAKIDVSPAKNETSRKNDSLKTVRRAMQGPPLTKTVEVAVKRRRESNFNDNIRYEFEEPPLSSWLCRDEFCEKVEDIIEPQASLNLFPSHSRCLIACSGVQLWPLPTGYSACSKSIVALNTQKLQYRLQTITSQAVSQHLSEAFTIFISNLLKQEKMQDPNAKRMDIDIPVREIYINVDVESDVDPRMRLDTDESYMLKLETLEDKVLININATSFCGARHGLETLSQVILVDQCTGYLITDSNLIIKDAPKFQYRGLMLDTGRNFIPLKDIMRTIDGMSSCKLNTFHWRISDPTSFPLALESVPELHQYGAYDKSMVYTEKDVRDVVQYAGYRGVRVLMEVAVPGSVGRPWSWNSEITCSPKVKKKLCSNILCFPFDTNDTMLDILQRLYTDILNLTKVDDMFHLSNGLFNIKDCYADFTYKDSFLDDALHRLKQANGGSLPKLLIVWYNMRLRSGDDAHTWDRYGIQLLTSYKQFNFDPEKKYNIIHSWDFSYKNKDFRTWQEVYKSQFWKYYKKYTNEGGEALVWTDFVGHGGLDHHIWPRAAAVAERLWSDTKLGATVSDTTYMSLDLYRWRILRRGLKVPPIWSVWCSHHPRLCLRVVKNNL